VSTEVDILVAGGGLAGLTAGMHAARLGHRTTVIAGHIPGGQLLNIEKIEGLPGFPEGIAGYELCPMAQEQASAAGAHCIAGEVEAMTPGEAGWRVATTEGEYAARAVVLAAGADLKALGVPGEARLRGKGVGHCASCDAPLLKGKTIAVVGGGDSACQEGLVLAAHAAKVILLHRGPALTAQAVWRERVSARANIELRTRTLVVEILGESGVTGLRLRDAARDEASELAVDGVFVYIGLAPNTAAFGDTVERDARDAVLTDGRLRSSARGVFAAGSVRAGTSGQAAGAVGDGALAAFAAHEYLASGEWPAAGRPGGHAGIDRSCQPEKAT
jgi:thioredoxin reductase (NADPH)